MKVTLRSVIGLALGLALAFMPDSAQAQVGKRAKPAPGQPGWVSPDPLAPDAPNVVCFAEGTDPQYVEAINTLVALRNQAFFGADFYAGNRWSGTLGTPRTLTWSFVPDGLSISSGVGEPVSASTMFATFDAAFSAQGGRATWILRFQQVFDRWHALTGISYTRITSGANDWDDGAAWGSAGSATRGDVRISAHPIDGASNVLAYTFFPSNGDMVFDTNDSGNYASSSNLNRFLRNTAAHEHGHGFGLSHVCSSNSNQLMEPFLSTSFDGPQQDDVRGGAYLYGDPYENNETTATATDLGNLVIGTPINRGVPPAPISGSNDPSVSILAMSATTQSDYFRFTIASGMTLSVTATPTGTSYDDSPQNQSTGACTTGTTTNALAQGNLQIEVRDTNGVTVLGTSNTAAAGVAEVLSNVTLSNAGTYFVRVSCSTLTSGESQLYRLNLTGTSGSACPSFTTHPITQQVCDGGSVVLTVAATGLPAPTFQWRRNTIPLANGGNISGATTPSLTINPFGSSDAADYDCVATNSCGPVPSNAATLTMLSGIVITEQPHSQTVPLGTHVTFSVTATGASNYQWYLDSSPILGANASTYDIPSVSNADVGAYQCLLTSACSLVYTDEVTLAIGTSCYANCDGSTTPPVLNVLDFSCYLNRFAANDPYANCDGSTTPPVLNVLDFSCYLNMFAAGCP